MSAVNPLSNPGSYDSITIGRVRWPPAGYFSKLEVAGASSPRNWDKVASQGADGMTVKYTGAGLAEFTIKFYLWEPDHFDYFEQAIRPLFSKPSAGKKPVAYPIEYPELQKLQIDRCVITEVGGLENADPSGLWFYPVKFLEFRVKKPVQVLKTKVGLDASASATLKEDADDRANRLKRKELADTKALIVKAKE